jgi:hypothetical protein
MSQLTLTLAPIVEPTYEPEATIQQRYEQWRDLNPWVLPWMARRAEEWVAAGGRRVSVKHLAEVLRASYFEVVRTDNFRVNNNVTSRLARDLIDRYPHLAECIETRVLRAA